MAEIRSYKDLEVWQLGMEVVRDVYEVCSDLPSDEKYGLASQMKRAAVSIPSNIAEGFTRHHLSEYIQFLYIAFGSAAELETQLILTSKIMTVEKVRYSELQEKLTTLMKKLNKLTQMLQNKPKPKTQNP